MTPAGGDAAILRRVLETVPLAIAVFEMPSRRLVQANARLEGFIGQPVARLLGSSPGQWPPVVADGVPWLDACLDLAAESPPGVRREVTRPRDIPGEVGVWDVRFVAIEGVTDDPGADSPIPLQVPGSSAQALVSPILMVADEVTDLRLAEQERFDAAIAQRGMLVQEVHHRIKNNLQGVAGLLQQTATRFPDVAPILTEAVGQLQAIAHVYGLQVGSSGPVPLAGLLRAVCASVQRTFNRDIVFDAPGDEVQHWRLPEMESIPVALTVNELLTNAIKHGGDAPVTCRLQCGVAAPGVTIEIANKGRLREGFDVSRVGAGASGLGLVKALLPRRSADLGIAQEADGVVTRVSLRPPAVRRDG